MKRVCFCTESCYLSSKNLEISCCTGVYIFVLKVTFLYWDAYCCTGVYFILLYREYFMESAAVRYLRTSC